MSTAMATTPGDRVREDRGKKAAAHAVERALGNDASPELKKAAVEAVAPWAEKLVRWLDDFIRIPGTKFGIGLDPILGFFLPGAGDVITGTGSISLLFLALKERVPTIVLLRMIMNILVDTLGGFLPVVGDAFDVVWRSNKRNLALIEKYREDPKADPTVWDYVLVGVGLMLAVASIVIPIVIIYVIGAGAILGIGSLFGE
ncbi:MAG: DUF4112 domain-containing protein [Sandaracinaceae bacterium]|nr:DUF4112 domain-containing protein [Sandaracinaceae bacterium]